MNTNNIWKRAPIKDKIGVLSPYVQNHDTKHSNRRSIISNNKINRVSLSNLAHHEVLCMEGLKVATAMISAIGIRIAQNAGTGVQDFLRVWLLKALRIFLRKFIPLILWRHISLDAKL